MPYLFAPQSILLRPIGDAVGDAVAACAHLRQLRTAFPNARLGVFATERNLAVLQAARLADEYLPAQSQTFLHERGRWDLFIDCLEKLTADHFLQAHYLNATLILANKHFLIAADQIAANPPNCAIYLCPPAPYCHIRDYLSQSVLGKYLPENAYFYLPPHPLSAPVSAQHWQPDRLRVLLSPTGTFKAIQPAEFGEILNRLPPASLPKLDLLLSWSPIAQAYYTELKTHCRPDVRIRLSPKTSLDHFLALVDSSDLVISVDTGTLHLATAYQKPVAGFYSNCPPQLAMWKPSPINNTPTLLAIGANPAPNENDTAHFNLDAVQAWLTDQIARLLAERA